jgi:hypothetical protein
VLERAESHGKPEPAILPFGVEELDVRLPAAGLQLGRLHEVIEGGPAAEYAGLAALFTAGVLARIPGPVLWCLRGRDLFAPALARTDDRAGELRPEAIDPRVTLAPMTAGREVVEDYRAIGLSLRAHPLSFLRERLPERGYTPCSTLRKHQTDAAPRLPG